MRGKQRYIPSPEAKIQDATTELFLSIKIGRAESFAMDTFPLELSD